MGPLVRFGIPAIEPQPEAIVTATNKLNPVFGKIESLMGVSGPSAPLRAEITSIAAIYVAIPDPTHQLRNERRNSVSTLKASIGSLNKAGARLTPRGLSQVDLQRILNLLDLAHVAAHDANAASETLDPPSARRSAGLMYVAWHLGGLFAKHTQQAAKVTHDREPDRYRGDFFEIVDTILTALGSRQSNGGRGRMIDRALKGELLDTRWDY